jgi:hypothetical protein
MPMKRAVAGAMILAATMMSGCRVSSDKQNGGDDVKIATPFGGLQVRTDEASVLSQIGLPAYPGAVLVKKDNGKGNGSADVNLSFGSFHLKVKAAGYRTTDSPDKVMAFYRKAMAQYGDVIECEDKKAVGTPVRTSEGLTCEDDSKNHISVSDDISVSGKMELKAGSKQRLHVVEIDPEGMGTKFGLVALELPGHISGGDNDGQNRQ